HRVIDWLWLWLIYWHIYRLRLSSLWLMEQHHRYVHRRRQHCHIHWCCFFSRSVSHPWPYGGCVCRFLPV
ncbi:hypothetical protein LTR40_014729, partial [Exophiala xenobiotica]